MYKILSSSSSFWTLEEVACSMVLICTGIFLKYAWWFGRMYGRKFIISFFLAELIFSRPPYNASWLTFGKESKLCLVTCFSKFISWNFYGTLFKGLWQERKTYHRHLISVQVKCFPWVFLFQFVMLCSKTIVKIILEFLNSMTLNLRHLHSVYLFKL